MHGEPPCPRYRPHLPYPKRRRFRSNSEFHSTCRVCFFFACLLAAIGLVYLASQKKFGERIVIRSDDYIYQFLPRHLATREDYSKGFMIYFGALAAAVVFSSLIGPKNWKSLGIPMPDEISYVVVPLFLAMSVHALPNVPILLEIEKLLRKYAHEKAHIPAAARATAERLAAADFNFTGYKGEALQSPEMHGVELADFTQSRRSLEHDWARLSCLVYEQKSRRMAGILEPLDAGLVRDYEKDLDNIERERKMMESEVAAYRIERFNNPTYTNDALRRVIRNNLYKLYVLLACAVRLKKQPHNDINLALRQFGFVLADRTPKSDHTDLKLVCLGVAGVITLVLEFVAAGLAQFNLWKVSVPFPQTFSQPFIDTAPTLIVYVAAIMTADLVRQRAIKKGRWFGAAGSGRRAANYVRVAFFCGIAGYLGLVLWGLTLQSLTITQLKMEAPNALLAMATGGFYVYHLDNAEIGTRPFGLWEVGSQTMLTGIFGVIAACASWDIALGSASGAVDKIILQTAISTAIGFLLAWYIPQAAACAKYDPLAEAREERIGVLEAAARDRFGNPEIAANWLDTQHPALDHKSPRAAAVDLEDFEHALGLLRGPRALAA